MELSKLVDRKAEIRAIEQSTQHVKQRIAQAAEELNRAGDLAKHVELANEALCKFTYMLYSKDGDGIPANVDNRTGRLLVPAPWGSAGWKHWGLRKWEGEIMRAVLMNRVQDHKRPSLFDYNTDTRTWHLNISDYNAIEAAIHYLTRAPITLAEWRVYTDRYIATTLARRRQVSGK